MSFCLVLICCDRSVPSSEQQPVARSSKVEPLPRVLPKEPADALKTFELQEGFRIELVAAEPLVTDPVAMKYDENGLAYVAEMSDYPYSDKSHDRAWEEQTSLPIGRVRVLEDTDQDGCFDKATIFADKLSWPTGLACWKGGVFVAATPDIWYFKDTNGDRKADIRRKVYTGFRKYNVQAIINNFQWGLDHWIYGAGASNSGNILPGNDPTAKPLRLGRNDFRFDARSGAFELLSGGQRFGHSLDDWGNRFLCNIRNTVQHVVLPARYLRRNPQLPVTSAVNDAAEASDAIPVYRISPPEAWRVLNAQRLAASPGQQSPHDSTVATGFVTSSSGITIYRGAAYPSRFYGNAFIGEVAGNLVMRYKLSPQGPTFRATRVHERVEFLASTDNWFRPVNFVNAPDGTLHVLDMYRETIEHPWSMPEDIKARVDLLSGRDRGRIYRIVPPKYPAGFQQPPWPRLGNASTAKLIAELENPNAWWRQTAHRLIFERQDGAAVAPLRTLLRSSQIPVARLLAIWSLDGLNALTDNDLLVALADDDPHVRAHAVRLAEPRLNTKRQLLQQVLAAADDDDMRVRFQTAFTLGEVDDARAVEALTRIARRDGDDRWVRVAVLSSLSKAATPFLLNLLGDTKFAQSPHGRPLVVQLASIVGTRNRPTEVNSVLEKVAKNSAALANQAGIDLLQREVVLGIGRGLKRARKSLMDYATDPTRPGDRLIQRLLADARHAASDTSVDLQLRQWSMELISCGDFTSARETLATLLDARQPREIQVSAVATLARFPDRAIAAMLIDKYPMLTPAVRTDVVNTLVTRQAWIVPLLDAIANRVVLASQVSQVRQTLLMKSNHAQIRERAIQLFGGNAPSSRQEVIARYRPVLAQPADPARGEVIFKRECFTCHRLGNQGYNVGPNLATILNRTPDEILVNVLDPNRVVSPEYLQYVVVTDDGRVETGIIVAETPSSITLLQAEDKRQTILRASIEQIRGAGISLMPEGLEQKIQPQEMADLIAYVKSLTYTAAGLKCPVGKAVAR